MSGQINPIDVWLKFDNADHEEATYEANTFHVADGFEVQWYHNDVGQVSSKWFPNYTEAQEWLTSQGFEDFSS